MAVTVTIHRAALDRLLSSQGAGQRYLRKKADQVAAVARVNSAGHGSIPSTIDPGPVVGKSVKVTSGHRASLWVHNGTRPHVIRPRGGRRRVAGSARSSGQVLRFEVGGQVVYARKVNHPGYVGDKYLWKALVDVIR